MMQLALVIPIGYPVEEVVVDEGEVIPEDGLGVQDEGDDDVIPPDGHDEAKETALKERDSGKW